MFYPEGPITAARFSNVLNGRFSSFRGEKR